MAAGSHSCDQADASDANIPATALRWGASPATGEPMDPKITLTPTLRIDRIGSPQADAQSRRRPFPFSRGQVLQGVVTGRDAEDRFYLDVGGTRLVARSGLPLKVGQQLDLQVVATRPQATLQVLEDPLTRDIGTSIHLLTRQGSLLAETAALAGRRETAKLSPQARQTLQFFAAAAQRLSAPAGAARQPDRALAVLTTGLATGAPGGSEARDALAGLRGLLATVAQAGPEQGEISGLATEILKELDIMERSLPPGPAFLVRRRPAGQAGDTGLNSELRLLLEQADRNTSGSGRTGQAAELMLALFPDRESAPSRLLLLIVELHQRLGTAGEATPAPSVPAPAGTPQGEEIRHMVDRLGLDMERLLAEGRRDEAVQTLKSALLEITHAMTASGRADQAPDHLLATLELYQMLQIRLAPEGLFFLPLPMPFLDQGYLLVDEEQSGGSRESGGKEEKTMHLHLQLQGLGNIQVDISHQGEGVSLRFLAQDKERAEFMAEHRDELRQWLTALRLDSASFLAGAGDPAAGLLRRMLPAEGSGILDTRA